MKKNNLFIFMLFQCLAWIVSFCLFAIMLYENITMNPIDRMFSDSNVFVTLLLTIIILIYFSFYSFLLFLIYTKSTGSIILKSIVIHFFCLFLLYIFASNPDMLFIYCLVIQLIIQLIGHFILFKRAK